MKSGMYRNNSSFLQNLVVYLLKWSTDTGIRGFRPINEEMDTMKIKKSNNIVSDSNKQNVCDSLKLRYIEKFLNKTKNINFVFVVSPIWYGQNTLKLEPIKEVCKKRNIRLINFSNSTKYVHHNEFFKDGTHLNSRGADEFTRDLIMELKKKSMP